MKTIERGELILRRSIPLFYNGGQIWCEELDGLSTHKDILLDKFSDDLATLQKPSTSGFVAMHLKNSLVDEEVAQALAKGLCGMPKVLCKVAFIGMGFKSRLRMRQALKAVEPTPVFQYNFINDYEDAKAWLMNNEA